jgi:hypothetical protein
MIYPKNVQNINFKKVTTMPRFVFKILFSESLDFIENNPDVTNDLSQEHAKY